jgi:hypothetical protein
MDEMCNYGFQPDAQLQSALLHIFQMAGEKTLGYQLLEKLSRLSVQRSAERANDVKSMGNAHRRNPSAVPSDIMAGQQPRRRGTAAVNNQFQRYTTLFGMCFFETRFVLDPCEACSANIADGHIRSQWRDDPDSYGIVCPECKETIVPRFQILVGDETPNPQNSLEYQSPPVLQKNIQRILEHKQASYLMTAHFNEDHPSTFWNLAWHLTNHHLPIDFCILRVDNTNRTKELRTVFAPGMVVSPRKNTATSKSGGIEKEKNTSFFSGMKNKFMGTRES